MFLFFFVILIHSFSVDNLKIYLASSREKFNPTIFQNLPEMSSYALYRGTTLGQALDKTLEDMESEGLLTKSLASKVLQQFDKSMNKQISRLPKEKMNFCATQLLTYRYCDNVWTFILNNVTLKDPQRSFDEPIDK